MDDVIEGVDPAASPAADTQPAPPAEAQNTGTTQPTEQQVPFHQHPRWQQVMGENRQLKQTVSGLMQWKEQMERQAQAGAPPTPEQQMQFQQAAGALRQIIGSDPELKALLELAKNSNGLLQAPQAMQAIQQSQFQALTRSAQSRISELAKAEGLAGDARTRRYIESMVTDEILSMGPEAVARYRQGDQSVISEAFEQIKGFTGSLRRSATTNVLQTKDATNRLPPRPAGGQAGPVGTGNHEPGSKGWWAEKRAAANAVIRGGRA
jgi:hypothetical protein